MSLSREQINNYYIKALEYFKTNYPQFLCTIEQNTFVVQINYQDVNYLNSMGISHAAKGYRCVTKIMPNGNFYMADIYVNNENSSGLEGNRLTNGAFAGKSINVHYEIDKNNNEYIFRTSDIQKPVKEYFKGLGLKYKFYSYSFDLQALPKPMRIVSIVVPLFCGVMFTLFSFLFKEIFIPFIILGLITLLWGIINLLIVLRKDEE